MSYSAYVSCTPFRLVEPVSVSRKEIERIMEETLDDYDVSLEEDEDGSFTFEMLDSQDVGDSFNSRLADLCEAIQPWVATPFELMQRNCDTASDDRDAYYYGGPNKAAIEAFQRQKGLERAIEELGGVPGVADIVATLKGQLALIESQSLSVEDLYKLIEKEGYEVMEFDVPGDRFVWWYRGTAESNDLKYTTKEAAARDILKVIEAGRTRLSLRLDVVYQRNGHQPAALHRQLSQLVDHAVGEGMLTGSLESEVVSWSCHVGDLPLRSPAPEPAKVMVMVEGGLVHSVIADQAVDCHLVDFDTDGEDPAALNSIPREGGGGSDAARITPFSVEVRPVRLEQIAALAKDCPADQPRLSERGG